MAMNNDGGAGAIANQSLFDQSVIPAARQSNHQAIEDMSMIRGDQTAFMNQTDMDFFGDGGMAME